MTFQLCPHVVEPLEKAAEVAVQATDMAEGSLKAGRTLSNRSLIEKYYIN